MFIKSFLPSLRLLFMLLLPFCFSCSSSYSFSPSVFFLRPPSLYPRFFFQSILQRLYFIFAVHCFPHPFFSLCCQHLSQCALLSGSSTFFTCSHQFLSSPLFFSICCHLSFSFFLFSVHFLLSVFSFPLIFVFFMTRFLLSFYTIHFPLPLLSSQGWEESCDAAVSHLLRTCLSRSPKDQATTLAQAGGPVLGLPRDTARLKKHITLLCDRIAKGGRLTLASEANVQVPAQVQNLAAPGESGRGRVRKRGMDRWQKQEN